MNKSLFTAIIRSTGNAGGHGCVPSADSKPIYNINVAWLNFNNSNHGYNRFKEITYNYDLISGKVNEVDYQPGAVDQFYPRCWRKRLACARVERGGITVSSGFSVRKSCRLERSLPETPADEEVYAHIVVSCS